MRGLAYSLPANDEWLQSFALNLGLPEARISSDDLERMAAESPRWWGVLTITGCHEAITNAAGHRRSVSGDLGASRAHDVSRALKPVLKELSRLATARPQRGRTRVEDSGEGPETSQALYRRP